MATDEQRATLVAAVKVKYDDASDSGVTNIVRKLCHMGNQQDEPSFNLEILLGLPGVADAMEEILLEDAQLLGFAEPPAAEDEAPGPRRGQSGRTSTTPSKSPTCSWSPPPTSSASTITWITSS
jgi:hypothetical protein